MFTIYQLNFSQDSIVLGGTHQHADWDTEARKEDRDFIWEGCKALRPSAIEGSKFVKDWVGLRPGRNAVRLERDKVSYKNISYDVSTGDFFEEWNINHSPNSHPKI